MENTGGGNENTSPLQGNLLTGGIFESGAYGVPSKSQNPTILDQGGPIRFCDFLGTPYLSTSFQKYHLLKKICRMKNNLMVQY